jgi:hypothetical protein
VNFLSHYCHGLSIRPQSCCVSCMLLHEQESLLFVPTTQLSICHATNVSVSLFYLSIYCMIQLQELGLNTNMSLVHHHVAHVRTRTCCKKPFFPEVNFHQVWQPKKENPAQLIQKIFVNKKTSQSCQISRKCFPKLTYLDNRFRIYTFLQFCGFKSLVNLSKIWKFFSI